ncbi:DUF4132 domain-containing protein [Dactylosporangium sp. NPDC005555]|uniref:DUF4132 domain-containing protein n=1 Tax=Dactylosporangium sp. NPDC005555 TaxID=3154889 RepID=UPI0033B2D668
MEAEVTADPTVMAWEDGERELWWSRAAALEHGREQPAWVTAATSADTLADLTPAQLSWLLVKGPEASARALLNASLLLVRARQQLDLDRVAVARFELDALPLALHDAREHADRLGWLMLPFRGPEPAALVAGWLRHLGSARQWARLWLHRHAEAAARALVPVAEGRPGRARQQAEDALRFLMTTGHEVPVVKTAAGPAPRKRRGLTQPLAEARLAAPPEPPPGDPAPHRSEVPFFVASSSAAQPFVHEADPEMEKLIADCDNPAELGRTLLRQWLADGMPVAGAWVLPAQAHVGDDATMDMLAPLVRSWPARSRYARAVDGFAVLATVGTDVALRHLLAIEAGMSGGPTNERALAYLTQAAALRGLSVTQLADRLTVTHGLDTGRTLDYGPRAFTIAVDAHLTPHVVDAGGRRSARPPKPGARDTNPDAYQHFLQLKKDLRATASAQIARLHKDMLTRRLRPARDLPTVVLPHPILGPPARRLLWGEYDGQGRLLRALRIAEDGSFADIDDATALVDDGAQLGIVHPADLGDDLARWAQIGTDYEILPPFAQLHRPVVLLTPQERAATGLPGFGPVPADRLAALEQSGGWQGNGYHPSSRVHTQLAHTLPGGLTLVVELEPGLPALTYTATGEVHVTEIWVDDAWSDHLQRTRHIPMGACDAAALSELLVELRPV